MRFVVVFLIINDEKKACNYLSYYKWQELSFVLSFLIRCHMKMMYHMISHHYITSYFPPTSKACFEALSKGTEVWCLIHMIHECSGFFLSSWVLPMHTFRAHFTLCVHHDKVFFTWVGFSWLVYLKQILRCVTTMIIFSSCELGFFYSCTLGTCYLMSLPW